MLNSKPMGECRETVYSNSKPLVSKVDDVAATMRAKASRVEEFDVVLDFAGSTVTVRVALPTVTPSSCSRCAYGALDDSSVEAGDDRFEEDVLIENERHVIEQPQAARTKIASPTAMPLRFASSRST